ncbi:MAG: T9SS type A sorting domain-containing protein [Chitinophagaceae bacterium]
MKKLLRISNIIIIVISSFLGHSLKAQPGFLDPTFGNNGFASSLDIAGGYSTSIQSDGKILVGGYYGNFLIERFNQDGSNDLEFGNNGSSLLKIGYATGNPIGISEVENNKIIFAGWYLPKANSNYDIIVVRLNSNGSIDSSFGINGIATMDIDKYDYAESMLLQPDGKIIVSGELGKNENDRLRTFITRFNSNGSIDNSFGENGNVITKFDVAVTSVASQLKPNGEILTAGTSGLFSSRPSYYIMNYNSDGSVKNNFGENGIATYTFGVGQGSDDWANELRDIILQPDGKIICGGHEGDYIHYNYDMGLVRFNSDGSLDNTYGTNGTIVISYPDHYSLISTLMMQPDGKLIAGGNAIDYNMGVIPMLLFRFLDNGNLDPDFAVNGMQVTTNGEFSITCSAGCLDAQGKIILVGHSNYHILVARFNGDNVLADHFKEVKAVQNNDAVTITWQTLNEISTKSFTVERSGNANDYVGINSVPAKGLASNYSYTDKSPLDGISYYRIRENVANGTNTFSPVVKVVFNDNGIISLYPNPAKNTVTVKGLNKNINAVIKIIDMQGREISSQNFTQSSSATLNIRALSQGTYFVQVAQEGKVVRLKMVKE